MNDLISRQQALKEMWKALYEYEDKTEKQFQKSKDLDVRDWIMNDRLWVQNGHNLCVNVLANLPSAQPEKRTDKRTETHACDLISRQAAIDAFEPEHDTDWYTPQIIEVLEALPPVQPTQTNADSTHENTLDCVSRQQAIDVIKKEILERDGRFYKGLLVANHVIVHLPSAQPERKKGKWIYHSNWESDGECGYECSECGMGSDVDYGYCMRCGARMDGDSE